MNPTSLKTPFPLMVDAYQASMYNQIPNGMSDYQCSQLTHRGPLYPNEQRIISAGLQPFVEWLNNLVITREDIQEALDFYSTFGASNKAPYSKAFPWPIKLFSDIVEMHQGKLPVYVTGLPDGTAHYAGEPSVQIWANQSGMGELVGWLESEILPYMWQCSVVATRGRIRREKFFNLYKKLYPSLDDDDIYMQFNYKYHDFGRRGAANSLLTGYAHLINWLGTDTVDAAYWTQKYLNNGKPFGACSIPAMAHRTVTPWETEYQAYDNMIELYGDDLVSIVADSYDFFNGCDYLASQAEKIKEKGGVLIVRPDCYDDQTEILTVDGWKLFSEISLETKVAQYNEDKSINFVNPIKYVNEDYSGPMYEFKNKIGRIDLKVTPNHRMIKRNRNNDNIVIQEASDVTYYYEYIHEVSGFLQNENSEALTNYERLLIAFQADGSYESGELNRKNKINDYYKIRFTFTKQRKVKRLIKILIDGKFKFQVSYEKSRPQNTQIYVEVPNLPSKTFNWVNLSVVNSDWCKEFIEELSYWDATRREEYRYKYTSGNKINIDIVQSICSLGGIKTKYTKEIDNRSDLHNDMHTLHINISETGMDSQTIEKEEIEYNGKIYCVQVPSGMIVVRRNNCVSISGNSGDPIECIIYALNKLDEKFGSFQNSELLKMINGAAIIQGDGVSDEDIFDRIIPAIIKEGYCPSNVAFGMGQHNHKATRSDLDTAYKTCEVLRATTKHSGINIKSFIENKKLVDITEPHDVVLRTTDYNIVPVMKASNTQNKMSFPCPVAMNSSDDYLPRLYPISRLDLENENTGDYVQFYGYDNKSKVYEKRHNITFDQIRKNAHETWNKLYSTGHLDNNIYPEILRMQKDYIERTKCQK